MINKIGIITMIVKDLDEAATFYVEKLGFTKQQDTTFGPGTRWVTISPKNQPDIELTLVKAHSEETTKALGGKQGTMSC